MEFVIPCQFVRTRGFNAKGRDYYLGSFIHHEIGSFEMFCSKEIFDVLSDWEYLGDVELSCEIRSNDGRLNLSLKGVN